ncbi:DoxX family protein [Acidisoma cellulosilytica]|uniref:DoxX family protein n=1 Tax=Acidisoma cellulosilyticum TaxID=2802395 RepID=A0A964E2C3_9PROT|nr:DoxX family protein [Acidisoma cellulosilyticum]MCB8878688.1 DoxX family protein [Acidisoma cellulosilyticum]
MLDLGIGRTKDGALLAARILMMLLFVLFGWDKLTSFGDTIGFMSQTGVPDAPLAAVFAVVMEFFIGLALVAGVMTRLTALLMAAYTLATAIVGHPFWTMSGPAAADAELNFFKNISIIGGLLAIYVGGGGRYSVDATIKLEHHPAQRHAGAVETGQGHLPPTRS